MKRIAIALVLAGCGGSSDDPADERLEALPTAQGHYELVSSFDVTVEALLPVPAHDALGVLTGLREDPAGVMFDVLDAAGVPLADNLRAALPGVLENKIEDWMNSALTSAGFVDEIDLIIAEARTVLTQFQLVTQLDIGAPDAVGKASGVHTVTALAWPHAALGMTIPLPLAVASSVETQVALASGGDANLVIGAHSFGIVYGDVAFQALDAVVRKRTGAGLRDRLASAAKCETIGKTVADKCILGACVGHADDIEAICKLGIDAVVDQIHARFQALRFDAVELSHGLGLLSVDALADGVWTASINAGQGLRPAPATFAGIRRP